MVVAGLVLAVVSACLPWFGPGGFDTSLNLVPLASPTLRGSVGIVLATLVAGVVLLARTGSPALVGCAGTLWATVSATVWTLGSRLAWIAPSGIWTDATLARVRPAVGIGMAAGLLIVVGAVSILTEQTTGRSPASPTTWASSVGIGVAALLLATRGVGWMSVHGGALGEVTLGFEVVPFLGDALAHLVMIGAVLALVLSIRPTLLLSVSAGVCGLAVAAVAIIGLIASGLITAAAAAAASRIEELESRDIGVAATTGPLAAIAAGIALSLYALFAARRAGARSEHAADGPAAETRPALEMPELPF